MKITTFSTRHNVILGSGVTLGSTDEWQAPSLVAPLTNASGGNLVAGDVVVIDPSADESFTTTTTALVADRLVGVLADDIDDGEVGLVYVGGYVPFVNVNGVSVTRGYFLGTATVAGAAQAVSTRQAGTFGQLLTGGTTPTAIIAAPDDGGGSVADITDLPTAETDTTKRLAPDGAGGVEWGTGGSGIADMGSFTYLDATDGSAPANPSSGYARIYSKAGRVYSRDSAGNEYGPFDAAGAGTAPDSGSVMTATPFSSCSLGGIGYAGLYTGLGSGGWTLANRAILVPFVLPEARTVYKVGWINGGTPSGHADVGVYDASGNLLTSCGSTACSGANVAQVADVADTALSAGTLYYMAMAMDGTQPIYRTTITSQVTSALGVRQKASSFPLPNPLTGTADGSALPMMFLETVAL